ncbi:MULTISPECIES: hypothetical protein [Acidiphilium]|nr:MULTISPECIES: hypothetical protein [Acidiphilium]
MPCCHHVIRSITAPQEWSFSMALRPAIIPENSFGARNAWAEPA